MGLFIPTFEFAEPSDFTGISGMLLSFDQSTRRVSINVSISDDMIFEGTEIFQASLTLVDPFIPTVITVSPSLANISIEDDDSKPNNTLNGIYIWNYVCASSYPNSFTAVVIGFETEEYTVFESVGVVTLVVSVTEGNIGTPITVALSTINGSALGKF